MTEVVGKNTPASAELLSYIDRIERIDAQKKQLSQDRTAILQEAKSRGFSPAGIGYVVKVRKLKPHDRQEAESIRDVYMHAAGMDNEPPLFRQIQALANDIAGGEKLMEAFKLLVPDTGDVILNFEGKKYRIYRDKDGQAQAEDYVDPVVLANNVAGTRTTLPPASKKEVPNCSEAEAEALGEAAAKDNKPVIDNPFPFDDARRPRWDKGWRKGSGNDGMGPQ